MSLEIDWSKITEDGNELNEKIREYLDLQFQSLQLPSFLSSVSVNSFDIGTKAPDITIKHISDPFAEFYEEDGSLRSPFTSSAYLSQYHNMRSPSSASFGDSPRTRQTSVPIEQNGHNEQNEQNEPITPPRPPGSISGVHTSISSTLLTGLRSWPFQGASNSTNLGRPSSPLNVSETWVDSLRRYNGFEGLNTDLTGITEQTDETTIVGGSTLGSRTPIQSPHHGDGNEQMDSGIVHESEELADNNDMQLFLEVGYSGDATMIVTALLRLNYPSEDFVTLPIKLTVTGLLINTFAVAAFVKNHIHFSFICDLDSEGRAVSSMGQPDRINIVQDIKIESEVGSQGGESPVLRNVGKVEKFVLEQMQKFARDEVAWPGWITFER